MARCSGLGGVPGTPRSLETRIMKKQHSLDVLKPGLKLSAPLETSWPLSRTWIFSVPMAPGRLIRSEIRLPALCGLTDSLSACRFDACLFGF